jgi:hypothetical protein
MPGIKGKLQKGGILLEIASCKTRLPGSRVLQLAKKDVAKRPSLLRPYWPGVVPVSPLLPPLVPGEYCDPPP